MDINQQYDVLKNAHLLANVHNTGALRCQMIYYVEIVPPPVLFNMP